MIDREVDAYLNCTGATNCQASMHVHGCYADIGRARCTEPKEHDLMVRGVRDVLTGEADDE